MLDLTDTERTALRDLAERGSIVTGPDYALDEPLDALYARGFIKREAYRDVPFINQDGWEWRVSALGYDLLNERVGAKHV